MRTCQLLKDHSLIGHLLGRGPSFAEAKDILLSYMGFT